jgi:hypothetical protein
MTIKFKVLKKEQIDKEVFQVALVWLWYSFGMALVSLPLQFFYHKNPSWSMFKNFNSMHFTTLFNTMKGFGFGM